jgi:CRP-like cAMP-binding protein
MFFRNFLKSNPAFKHFSDSDLDALSKAMHVEEYPDGHSFIYQGEQGKEMFMLVEGAVVVSRYDDLTGIGEELKVMHPGELFGLLSLVDNLPAAATCAARGPVKVASMPRTAYNLLFQFAAPIAHHFQYLVAEQLARDLRDRDDSLRKLLAATAH